MSSPLPDINVHPMSGLTIPWSEFYQDPRVGSFEASFGSDGCTLGMTIIIYWEDLGEAIQETLGYSWRDTSTDPPTLRRVLPWRHPYANQMWVKAISSCRGVQPQGVGYNIGPAEAAVGPNGALNLGPGTIYSYALLTLHFWRPPYLILSDDAAEGQEWLRYLDRNWDTQTQMLVRENSTYMFTHGAPAGKPFQGSVGQKVCHHRITRKWYELPERAVFTELVDKTPNGAPASLLFTRTPTTNPITGFPYPAGSPLPMCVNSPEGGGTDDADVTKRFFGCGMGTLLYEGSKIVNRPLQMPPVLMQIPTFASKESVSQVQVDVEMHFDLFVPPAGNHPFLGHNLMPYSVDGLWYPVQSPGNAAGGGFPTTPFQYADFNDLFTIQ